MYSVTFYIYTHTHTHEIVFSPGLNRLQVHQVDRKNDKRASTYTQLVPSKLVAARKASVE